MLARFTTGERKPRKARKRLGAASNCFACGVSITAWPSCIVAAPGPSLKPFDHEGIRLIAVNDAYRLFPKADILYGADLPWWEERRPEFAGLKVTCDFECRGVPAHVRLANATRMGITVIPSERGSVFSLEGPIRRGRNGGFQAINIALHKSKFVVLVGFDMKGTHFFGPHKSPLRQKTNFTRWIEEMREAARLIPKDYRIINATEDTALECFEKLPLAEALNEARQAGQAHINPAQD